MPRTLWLQFDNCGENKNKEMFAYLSLLVETFIFDEIEVGFLIVGHTHSSIDQYFSIISKAIKSKKTKFIGSPLAMKEIVKTVHKNSYPGENNPIVRDVQVYYDYKSWLAKFINPDIKYYGIPHYFRFHLVFGAKCAMQYKMFSDHAQYLPLPIQELNYRYENESIEKIMVDGVSITEHDNGIIKAVGGENVIKELTGGHKSENELMDMKTIKKHSAVNHVVPFLSNSCKLAINSIQLRLDDESNGNSISSDDLKHYKEQVTKEAISKSNKEYGYIFWLYSKGNSSSESLELSTSCPLPIFSVQKQNEYLSSSISTGNVQTVSDEKSATIDRTTECLFENILEDEDECDDDEVDSQKIIFASEEDIEKASKEMKQVNSNEEMLNKIQSVDSEDSEDEANDDNNNDNDDDNDNIDNEEPKVVNQTIVVPVVSLGNVNIPLIDITRKKSTKNKSHEREVTTKPKKSLLTTEEKLIQAARKIANASKNILHSNSYLYYHLSFFFLINRCTGIAKGSISKVDDNLFHFDKFDINEKEYLFYSDRDSEDKVMSMYAQLYRDAEPWVLFPPRNISSSYLDASDERLANAVKKAATARDIGLHMMTRVGSTHTDGQEVIQRSSNINQQSEDVQLIAERMKRRYQSSKSDSNDKRNQKKKFNATHICDICNCKEHALERTCKESTVCKTKYRYCNIHSSHSIHCKESKKKQREKISEQNAVSIVTTSISTDVNVNNNNNNNNNNNTPHPQPVVEIILEEEADEHIKFEDFKHLTEHFLKFYGYIGKDGIDLDIMKYRTKLETYQELLDFIEYDLENIEIFKLAFPDEADSPDIYIFNLVEAKAKVISKMNIKEAQEIIVALPEEVSNRAAIVIPSNNEKNNADTAADLVEMNPSLDMQKMNKLHERLNSIIKACATKPEMLQDRLLNDLMYPDYVYGMRHYYDQWFSEKWIGKARGRKLEILVQLFVVEYLKRRTS